MALKYLYSGAAGAGTGADWANAFTTLALAAAGMAAGDDLAVAHDHAETQASAMAITFPGTVASPNNVYCANRAGSVPPVSADLRDPFNNPGGCATIFTTGNNQIGMTGNFTMRGILMSAASGASNQGIVIGSTGQFWKAKLCKFALGGTSGGSIITTSGNGCWEWEDVQIKFASSASTFNGRGKGTWRNPTIAVPAVDSGGTLPSTLALGGISGPQLYEGLDFSNLSGKQLQGNNASQPVASTIKDCKLPASITISAAQTGAKNIGGIDLIRCDSGTGYYRNERYTGMGVQTTSIDLARTGGAVDGTTPVSWKLATTANAKFLSTFETLPILIYNTVVGSNLNVTVEGIADPTQFSALPLNDEFWIDVEYMGDASTPLGITKLGTKADLLATGSALTASTQAWDSQATARANSTAYALGDIRKVASNPGRVFVCTTAGTSAGSEPAGYASAVDGGSVTDGTAVFKAFWRFKQTITLTSPQPQAAGPLWVYPKMAKASANIYIDPSPVISGVTVGKSYMTPGGFVNELSSSGPQGRAGLHPIDMGIAA